MDNKVPAFGTCKALLDPFSRLLQLGVGLSACKSGFRRVFLWASCYVLPVYDFRIRLVLKDAGHVIQGQGSEENAIGLYDVFMKARPLVCHDGLYSVV